MSNQQNIDDFFKEFERRSEEAQQGLAELVGTEVVNSVMENFKTESFFGEKWPERKDKKNKRKLLINTGTLWKSFSTNPKIIISSLNQVTVGSDVPYAAVHNNGEKINRNSRSETFVRNRHTKGDKKGLFKKGTTQGQGFTFKAYSYSMPVRKFLGTHPKLKREIEEMIKETLIKKLL